MAIRAEKEQKRAEVSRPPRSDQHTFLRVPPCAHTSSPPSTSSKAIAADRERFEAELDAEAAAHTAKLASQQQAIEENERYRREAQARKLAHTKEWDKSTPISPTTEQEE